MNNFYVYMYLREDHTPYYIGKGSGHRAYHPNHTMNLPKDKSRIQFIIEDISEDESLMWEEYWIDFFGRIDLGTACFRNLCDGGISNSGYKHTENWKKENSVRMKGNKHGAGKNHSEEWKKENSIRMKGNKSRTGQKNSLESNGRRSESLSGLVRPKILCPHCSKEGANNLMKRWHFENCKEKL